MPGKLASRSNAAAARATWESVKPGLYTALRISFGAALIVSIAVVYSAIFFLSTSSSSDDRRDERRGGGGGMGFGGGFGGGMYWGPSPFDVFYYRPYYSYGRSYESPQEMVGVVCSGATTTRIRPQRLTTPPQGISPTTNPTTYPTTYPTTSPPHHLTTSPLHHRLTAPT